jgi:YidC/Oxa1 family membrane protein insertase
MAKMRLVTPKLQRIREQYASDRQRMHQVMMEFYKEEKINPMGGCLPILVQIPVFIALFWTLLAAVELRYAPLALWITDMSVPDPYYVLPLIMGVSMWVQSKLSPTPTDPIQAKVMQIMPVAFSVFFFFFPAGLVLYSLCNNILSIAQQWQITRMFENKAEEEANKDKNRKKSKNKPESAKENSQPAVLTDEGEEAAKAETVAADSSQDNEKQQQQSSQGVASSAKGKAPVKAKSVPAGKKAKKK